jgi:hypothetical protein
MDNLDNIRCEASRHFSNKKREYQKGKINELATIVRRSTVKRPIYYEFGNGIFSLIRSGVCLSEWAPHLLHHTLNVPHPHSIQIRAFVPLDTIHTLSLYCNEQILCKMYK